ncbi:hypothetical protein EV192_111147 [Actinocrispum wychmicini]|uniref:Uncharacterized protein n=1 Tax=Actinocrispum wychmicini TaxID=1213861 RepID=A0A4R2J3D5_9PSEU|nr:hypothetical protein EV192_111147 [Actinocrispum wychmicini]
MATSSPACSSISAPCNLQLRRQFQTSCAAFGNGLSLSSSGRKSQAEAAAEGCAANLGLGELLQFGSPAAKLDVIAGPPVAACRSTGDRATCSPMEHQVIRRGSTGGVEHEQVRMSGQPPLIASVVVLKALHSDIILQARRATHAQAEERVFVAGRYARTVVFRWITNRPLAVEDVYLSSDVHLAEVEQVMRQLEDARRRTPASKVYCVHSPARSAATFTIQDRPSRVDSDPRTPRFDYANSAKPWSRPQPGTASATSADVRPVTRELAISCVVSSARSAFPRSAGNHYQRRPVRRGRRHLRTVAPPAVAGPAVPRPRRGRRPVGHDTGSVRGPRHGQSRGVGFVCLAGVGVCPGQAIRRGALSRTRVYRNGVLAEEDFSASRGVRSSCARWQGR